jgi:hypothetical protein
MLSMPCDTIQVVMETTAVPTGRRGAAASAAAFVATGRRLVAEHGPGGLFTGAAPRLAERVPSTALYWLAVEAARRALEPHTAPA